MKLKIRYENKYQTLEVETDEMWVSLSLEENEELTELEKEKMVQDAFNEQFNKPEYNNWHKFDRHRGMPKRQFRKDDEGEECDTSEPLMKEVADDRIFKTDEIRCTHKNEYEDVCQKVRSALGKKQEWADMFIAVRIDGMPIREYASSIGVNENNITKKLKRAEKKLKEIFEKRQI